MLIPGFIKSHLLFSLQCSPGCCTEVFIAHRPFGLPAEWFALTPVACFALGAELCACRPWHSTVGHEAAFPMHCSHSRLLPGFPKRKAIWERCTNFSRSRITMGSLSKDPGCFLRPLMCWRQLLPISRGSPRLLWLCSPLVQGVLGRGEPAVTDLK